ncbi:MAG: hypothetical protein ABW215_04470, partial [Kibdelosporangium sp.]
MSPNRSHGMRRRAAALGRTVLLAAVTLAPTAVPATTSTHSEHAATTRLADVRVLAHFDRAAGQAAESIALEPGGGAVIGMIP